MRRDLRAWQWEAYSTFHKSRVNLCIHLFAVPTFVIALLGVVPSLLLGKFVAGATCFAVTLVSFALQAIGHKMEANPSIPFDGATDALSRILMEQFVTFPRFVVSGDFARALRALRS